MGKASRLRLCDFGRQRFVARYGDAKSAHLRINLDQDQQKRIKTQMFSCTSSMSLFGIRSLVSQQRDCLWFLWIPVDFRFNAELSLRVACGVLLASLIQIRSPKYVPSMEHEEQWLFFPECGLSYCAVAVIFCAGKNVGETLTQVCQVFYGVIMALVCNLFLFSFVRVQNFDGSYDGCLDFEKKCLLEDRRTMSTRTTFTLCCRGSSCSPSLSCSCHWKSKRFTFANNLLIQEVCSREQSFL
ncbi:hypothetical protein PsorP6_016918 [Peronosclerospora sorghi]|uniref:Uncharacterized protein n=1 Tax=Peronosclerospora sorghi TaxID=230839 RepID=A0ACC0WE88_9STRA|nr:hypothetical protein PsorP6_016918 [Peronosclerospora sorghi]